MNFKQVSEDLTHILHEAEPLLQSLSEEATSKRPQSGKWSKKEILGHLLDSASNNHQRFVRAALQGELNFPAYQQAELVELQRPGSLDWKLLLGFWTSYNLYLAHVIASLPESAAEVSCVIGANPPATLLYLADDYVAHLKHHLNQLVGKRFSTSYDPNA